MKYELWTVYPASGRPKQFVFSYDSYEKANKAAIKMLANGEHVNVFIEIWKDERGFLQGTTA